MATNSGSASSVVSLPYASALATSKAEYQGISTPRPPRFADSSSAATSLGIRKRSVEAVNRRREAETFPDAQAPPTVTKLRPTSGPVAAGTSVVISGTNLAGATAVKFGVTNATSFSTSVVKGVTSITAVSPAELAGTVDVTVTTGGANQGPSPRTAPLGNTTGTHPATNACRNAHLCLTSAVSRDRQPYAQHISRPHGGALSPSCRKRPRIAARGGGPLG